MAKHFEVANSEDPEDMILATQRSICAALKDVVEGLKKSTDAPGLTWEQIFFLIEGFKNKKPEIYFQTEVL